MELAESSRVDGGKAERLVEWNCTELPQRCLPVALQCLCSQGPAPALTWLYPYSALASQQLHVITSLEIRVDPSAPVH